MELYEKLDTSNVKIELEPLNVPPEVHQSKCNGKHEETKVVLDDILTEEVGQFGRFQLITLFFVAFPLMFSAIDSSEYIFTTARINTRCRIPECDEVNPEFSPPWLLNAIPGDSLTSFENCQRYSSVGKLSFYENATSLCPAVLFNQSLTKNCEAYVYENQFSVVYDFGMACKEWQRATIGAIRTAGGLIALPFNGFVSDRWGRRVTLVMSAFSNACVGLVRSFVNSYEAFVALELLEDILGSGTYTACYVLVIELAGPKFRVLAGGSVDTIYGIGLIMLGLVAWKIPAWRSLTRIIYTPQLLVIFYFWILPESVRWLKSKGRYGDSDRMLKKMAKVNRKELSDQSLRSLRRTDKAEKEMPKVREPWLPVLVFRSRAILYRCLICPILWITNMLVYYGMTVNAVNLVGNSNLNFIAVTAIEIPGIWIAILSLDRVGRKPMIMSGYFICALCQFAFAFIPEDTYGVGGLRAALYLIGKFCISAVTTSIYVYTAELFPTRYRHSFIAFCTVFGRFGFLSAPLMPALALTVWKPLPSVMFGSCALLSGVLMFTTPETVGTKLPDTFEEAEQLQKNYPPT